METKMSKKTRHSGLFKGFGFCKQKEKMVAEDDPYARLPDPKEPTDSYNVVAQNSTANSTSTLNDTSGLGESVGMQTPNPTNSLAYDHAYANQIPSDFNDELNGGLNTQLQNSPEKNGQNGCHEASAEDTPPELPPRPSTGRSRNTGDMNTDTAPSRNSSFAALNSTDDHTYIHIPPFRNSYINYPHLEMEKSLTQPNEYTLQPSALPTRCSMNLPLHHSGDSLPPAHGQPRNRFGYLTKRVTSYITKSQSTLIQPPGVIQSFLNKFQENRTFGAIDINQNGGTYCIFNVQNNDITQDALFVSVPEKCVLEPTRLLFARSQNCEDFPSNLPWECLRSDVIHMLPHGKTFQEPLLARIPLYEQAREMDVNDLRLMYSKSDSTATNKVWKVLRNNSCVSTNQIDGSEPVWFFKDNHIYLYVTHFCMFVVVDNRSGLPVSYKPLKAILQLQYKPQVKGIAVMISFENQKAEDTQGQACEDAWQETSFMLWENNENLRVELQADEHWNIVGRGAKIQEVSYAQLSIVESLFTKPRIQYNLQCSDPARCRECENDRGLTLTLTIQQPNGDIPVYIDIMTSLVEISTSSRPAVPGRCETPCSQRFAPISADTSGACASPFKPIESSTRQSAQEHSDQLSTAALPYIKETYVSQSYDRKTNKGVLVPDSRVQNEIARLLDPVKGWEPVARELNIPVSSLHCALSPTKYLLHAYSLEGKYCNWTAFSDLLNFYNHYKAADILSEWHSEQTIPKEKYPQSLENTQHTSHQN